MAVSTAHPLLLFVFANDRAGDDSSYLRNLPAERRALEQIFEADEARPYDVLFDFNITPDGLRRRLDKHHDRIVGFHFGGHATQSGLSLETADGHPDVLWVGGFADELAGLPRLSFVFLNGCSTAAHVEVIRAACGGDGPVVVATEWAIRDDAATRFAARFYDNLRLGRSLREAFHKAEAQQRGDVKTPADARQPGLVEMRPDEVGCLELSYRFLRPAARDRPHAGPDWPWALFPAPGDAASIEWRLPEVHPRAPEFRPRARTWALALLALAVVVAAIAWLRPTPTPVGKADAEVGGAGASPVDGAGAVAVDSGVRDVDVVEREAGEDMPPPMDRSRAPALGAPSHAPTRRHVTGRRTGPRPAPATPEPSPAALPAAPPPDAGLTPGGRDRLREMLPESVK